VASQLRPVSVSRKSVTITIRPGTGASRIAQELKNKGLIRNERIFMWYASSRGDLAKLKSGEYRLSPYMSPAQILEHLKRGGSDSAEVSVTIPEGFTVAQIADTLKTKGIIANTSSFLKIAKNPDAIDAPFDFPPNGLEGFLYPDTYRFLPKSKPDKVAQVMVDTFVAQFYKPHESEIKRSPHTLQDTVTIASLIEREAEVPQDRPRIAGVIENRLKIGMRLQIDATIDYALGHHLNHVYFKDLQVESPYNTYRHKGLPPGAIANPGKASLEAALSPEKHAYLFYVASPDGSHVFTTSESEHRKAVARMRALRARDTARTNG